MENFEQNEFAELEEKLQKEVENIEVQPFNEVMKAIRPKLRKKNRVIFTPMVRRIAAVAACLMILVSGLFTYLSLNKDGNIFNQGGEDNQGGSIINNDDLTYMVTTKSEVQNTLAFNRLNLDLLSNDVYGVATHTQTLEPVYYVVQAQSIEGNNIRDIVLFVFLQPKYSRSNESVNPSGENVTVSGIEMTINSLGQGSATYYDYSIVFSIGNIRYNLGYRTMSEQNDTQEFMREFITV